MVYLRQWQDFAAGVRAMQDKGNTQSIRYCTKWRHSTGVLKLKVTDNQKCLQFRTRSAVFLNRFQVLNRDAMISLQGSSAANNARESKEETSVPAEASVLGVNATEGITSPEVTARPNDGAKKKKSKKRKH